MMKTYDRSTYKGKIMMWRLDILYPLFFGSLLVLVPGVHAGNASDRSPNVLFISVDDLNDWVNCLGGREGVHTPHIDRLAKRGRLFTNAHCSAPSCNPSRVSMMTGIRPSTSGIYNNRQTWRTAAPLKEAVTIPEAFRAGGYEVYGGGKIFHALSWIRKGYGKQQNDPDIWDHYFPSKENPLPDTLWPKEIAAKRSKNGYVSWKAIGGRGYPGKRPSHFFDWGPQSEPEGDMADAKVVDWAIAELSKKHEKPFFHAVGIFRPHIPWFAQQKYFDLYPLETLILPGIKEDDLDDCPKASIKWLRRSWHAYLLKNDLWKEAVQGYLASISFADAQVGRLLDALDESNYADNTIVVLWSDHGMHIGEKQQWEKFTLWEESTRVPLIIAGPGVNDAGKASAGPAGLIDVYPTLIEMCGLAKNPDLEGTSLVPQLEDASRIREQPALTTWGQNNHSVRNERWRYTRYSGGGEELYDHQNDPDEFTNLANLSQHAELKKQLAKWLPKVNAAQHVD